MLLDRGVNYKKVAEILGHADVTTLLNIYSHALPQDNEKLIQAISEAFGHAPQEQDDEKVIQAVSKAFKKQK